MKQLKLTVTIILAFLLSSGIASAQIQYTLVDDIAFHEFKYYDLDQNGSADIALSWDYDNFQYETEASAVIPLGANAQNGFVSTGSLATKMEANDLIDGSLSFTNDAVLLNEYLDTWDNTYYKWGNWDNMNPGESAYVGFRFADENDDLYYGWMRVYIDPSYLYITLFDMAWEDEVGKAILAGDSGSTVPVPGTLGIMLAGLLLLTAVKRQTIR